MPNLVVRKADRSEKDARKLFSLLMVMSKDVGLPLPAVSAERVLAQIANVIENGVCYMAEHSGDLVGAIGLLPETPWWSRENYLADTFFFVRSDKRASKAATKLLRAAKEYAEEKDRPLALTLFTGKDLFRKELFLAHHGFRKVGSLFAL